MTCPVCGGTLIGDGYTSVVHCENCVEDHMDKTPDDGPFYCDLIDEATTPMTLEQFNHSKEYWAQEDIPF